jgi:hypothetical protein
MFSGILNEFFVKVRQLFFLAINTSNYFLKDIRMINFDELK